jgi:hypothetical protein
MNDRATPSTQAMTGNSKKAPNQPEIEPHRFQTNGKTEQAIRTLYSDVA